MWIHGEMCVGGECYYGCIAAGVLKEEVAHKKGDQIDDIFYGGGCLLSQHLFHAFSTILRFGESCAALFDCTCYAFGKKDDYRRGDEWHNEG